MIGYGFNFSVEVCEDVNCEDEFRANLNDSSEEENRLDDGQKPITFHNSSIAENTSEIGLEHNEPWKTYRYQHDPAAELFRRGAQSCGYRNWCCVCSHVRNQFFSCFNVSFAFRPEFNCTRIVAQRARISWLARIRCCDNHTKILTCANSTGNHTASSSSMPALPERDMTNASDSLVRYLIFMLESLPLAGQLAISQTLYNDINDVKINNKLGISCVRDSVARWKENQESNNSISEKFSDYSGIKDIIENCFSELNIYRICDVYPQLITGIVVAASEETSSRLLFLESELKRECSPLRSSTANKILTLLLTPQIPFIEFSNSNSNSEYNSDRSLDPPIPIINLTCWMICVTASLQLLIRRYVAYRYKQSHSKYIEMD